MRGILFDLDGTLVDSSEGITKSVQYALKNYGIEEPDQEKLHVFIGPPLRESFAKYYGFSEEQAEEAVEIYRQRYNKIGIFECSLYPGAEDCIRDLKREGYWVGMASSKPETSCKRILEHFRILDLFDGVVGATMDGRIDTKEEVLREVFRRWPDIPAEEMCLIGDTSFDLEGAKLVGISCIAVSFGFGDAGEMLEGGAAAVCDHLADLPAILSELDKRGGTDL